MTASIKLRKYFGYLSLFVLLYACKPLIALYDQSAYAQAVSLKVDMQNLAMESDSVVYDSAKVQIDNVNVELQKAYEYSKGRDNNSLSTKQYEILISDSHFYKSFLNDWKTKGKESPTMSANISEQIGNLMDQVIKLENGKNK